MHMSGSWRPRRITPSLPGPQGANFHKRISGVLSAGTVDSFLSPVVQARKEGYLIVDLDGNEFIDCLAAWGAEPYGAGNMLIRDSMLSSWDLHGMQISLAVPSRPVLELAERLIGIAPESITRVELSVLGTQAVESAVRLMRESSGRPLILVFGPVYHGESTTLTAASSSDVSGVSDGATAYSPGIIHVPYPNLADSPLQVRGGEEVIDYINDWLLEYQLSPSQIAGVLIEPIATEGGVTIPQPAFWKRLVSLCEQHGWLLAVDEVQTGMGRTGTVFAAERWGLAPDIIILAKGLSGGGAPIAAILGSERVMGRSKHSLGSTFGWVPAAASAALQGVDILLSGVLSGIQEMEKTALEILTPLMEFPGVQSVSAAGAGVGVAFERRLEDGRLGVEINNLIHARMLDLGVLGLSESHKRHYRLQPPLTLPSREWRYSLEALHASVVAELP